MPCKGTIAPGRNIWVALNGSRISAFSVAPLTRAHMLLPRSDLSVLAPETLMKVIPGVEPDERLGHGQRQVVSRAPVRLLGHTERGHAQAEEACVVAAQLILEWDEVEQIRLQALPQLRMLLPKRAAPNAEDALRAGVEQAFAQHVLPDHAGRSEQDDVHSDGLYPFRKFRVDDNLV